MLRAACCRGPLLGAPVVVTVRRRSAHCPRRTCHRRGWGSPTRRHTAGMGEMDPDELSGALVAALITAGIAALGYVGKLAVTAYQAWRAEKRRRLARLLQLNALLSATEAVFKTILRLAQELQGYL